MTTIPQKNCAFHPNKPLVNFCRNPQCLLPMCPSCIKVHTAEHARLNTHANYDYLPDLYNEIQTQLSNTLRNVLNQGEQLQQVIAGRQNERTRLVNKMKETRHKILDQVNKYIDSVQQQFLNNLTSSESVYSQQLSSLSLSLNNLTAQVQSQISQLSSQKSLKCLISHISANMASYYVYSVNQVSTKINILKSQNQIVNEKQFKINQIAEFLKGIGICYANIFGNQKNWASSRNKEPMMINSNQNVISGFNVTASGTVNGSNSGTMTANGWLMNSSTSNKSRDCSTQGSFKKVM